MLLFYSILQKLAWIFCYYDWNVAIDGPFTRKSTTAFASLLETKLWINIQKYLLQHVNNNNNLRESSKRATIWDFNFCSASILVFFKERSKHDVWKDNLQLASVSLISRFDYSHNFFFLKLSRISISNVDEERIIKSDKQFGILGFFRNDILAITYLKLV